MKPHHLLVAIMAATMALSACRSASNSSNRNTGESSPAFRFVREGDAQAALGTNEVMGMATEAARTQRFKLDRYVCDFLLFQGWSTNAPSTYKWLAHFRESPSVPDTDFFVSVEDLTRRTEIHHY